MAEETRVYIRHSETWKYVTAVNKYVNIHRDRDRKMSKNVEK